MTYLLYDVVTSMASPVAALWLSAHPKYKPLLARFKPEVPPDLDRPLWVHACSVGEVTTAKPVIKAMRQRWPDIPVILTVSTVSGRELAGMTCAGIPVTWCPVDHKGIVRRFVRQLQPRALVLIETEIWPNLLRESRSFGSPVVLVNGRLSDKHYPRYLKIRRVLRPVIRLISAAGMQNREYADRFVSLGGDPAAVRVTGNTKFDGVSTRLDPELLERLRAENGFPPESRVLIFGSTRPGDEALAAACWKSLRTEFPDLRLIVAPRHIERLNEAIAPFEEPLLLRSEVRQGRKPQGERVFILDTVGELVAFYALATVAVVGGSFYPGVNGHNPLEPAALQTPTVFGPYMRNFIDPARELLAHGGAEQVPNPEALCDVLRRLLGDADARATLAAQGRRSVIDNQGAISRSLDLLESVLPKLG